MDGAPSPHGARGTGGRPLGFLSEFLHRRFSPWIPLAGIARELGHPQEILCLGNGPSSEGEELAGVRHDCLFRINPKSTGWHRKGRFRRPHLVFLAQDNILPMRDALGEGWPSPPLIFVKGGKVLRKAIRDGLVHARDSERIDFWVNREDLGFRDPENGRRARPTNGMTMLALAAALQPRRLVLAGFDFFSDPRGDYPGSKDSVVLERWRRSGGHSLALETRVCLRALTREFRGELVPVGGPLNRLLAEAGDPA